MSPGDFGEPCSRVHKWPSVGTPSHASQTRGPHTINDQKQPVQTSNQSLGRSGERFNPNPPPRSQRKSGCMFRVRMGRLGYLYRLQTQTPTTRMLLCGSQSQPEQRTGKPGSTKVDGSARRSFDVAGVERGRRWFDQINIRSPTRASTFRRSRWHVLNTHLHHVLRPNILIDAPDSNANACGGQAHCPLIWVLNRMIDRQHTHHMLNSLTGEPSHGRASSCSGRHISSSSSSSSSSETGPPAPAAVPACHRRGLRPTTADDQPLAGLFRHRRTTSIPGATVAGPDARCERGGGFRRG